jgi:CubicO group peptidase (beta-lactamase class C family)
MSYRTCLPGILFLLILSFACKRQEATPIEAEPTLKVASDFAPDYFKTDDRAAQISSLGPKLHRLFETYAREENIPGIAYGIVVDGQLVIDSALGLINLEKQIPASSTSQFRIASMTKSFTAMAIMKLVEDGKVALQAPAHHYIPELAEVAYPTADSPPITVENLLTMTAGFPEDNPWGDRQLDEPVAMLKKLIRDGPRFSNPPSHSFEYSNTGYALLGLVISNVTGMPYQEYITTAILHPLGMKDTYWEFAAVPADRLAIGYAPDSLTLAPMLHDGAYGAMGGLITSIRDFSKYVSYHLSAWPPRSAPEEGPVNRASLRKMQQPQYSRLFANARDWNDEPCPVISGYGYGLGISQNCHGTTRVSHGGALPGFGSNYVFYPDLGIGLMAFCNVTYTSPWPYDEIVNLLFGELDLPPRQAGVSEILKTRQAQLVEWMVRGDRALEGELMAENFFPDEDRERRMQRIRPLLDHAGPIQGMGDVQPRNQLRGSFELYGQMDTLQVFFTLTPEPDPKVQYLEVSKKN